MNLVEKVKQFQGNYAFVRWMNAEEYGKSKYVGSDFIQFDIVNISTMEYFETVFIKSSLILEVTVGGADIARIIAEVSSKLPEVY